MGQRIGGSSTLMRDTIVDISEIQFLLKSTKEVLHLLSYVRFPIHMLIA
jgi:hypothetical protein